MVDVPVYYFVGDNIGGGNSPGDLLSLTVNDEQYYTGPLTTGLIWDPDVAGGGAAKTFRPYDIATLPNPAGSSSTERKFVGAELGFIQQAAKREAALGAWLVKYLRRGVVGPAVDSPATRRWQKAAGEAYSDWLQHCNDAHAFIAQNPVNVRKARAIIVSMGWTDARFIPANTDTFYENFRQWIADLRADLATGNPADLPVIAHSVRGRRFQPDGLQADDAILNRMIACNDALRRLEYVDPKFKLIDWSDLRASLQIPVTFGTDDQNYPAPSEMLPLGRRLWAGYLHATESVPALPGAGVPVYFLIGQSHLMGSTSIDLLFDNRDDVLWHARPEHLTFIWDHNTDAWAKYNPFANSNTGPYTAGGPAVFGPDVTLLLKLLQRHPKGVFLFKVGIPGASLQNTAGAGAFRKSANQHYQWMQAKWNLAKRKLVTDLGVVPDVRGCFWAQGEGDADEPFASTYQAALTEFIRQFRIDFSTRSQHDPLMPFVISKTIDTGFFPRSILKVRAAQEAIATADPQASIVDMDDVPVSTDGVHHTGRGTLILGERLDKGLDEVDNMCAIPVGGGSPTPESASPSGGGSSGITSSPASAPMASSPTTNSSAEQIVAAMDAAASNGGIAQYTVNGQTVTLTDPAKILQVRDYYASLLANRAVGGRRTRASL